RRYEVPRAHRAAREPGGRRVQGPAGSEPGGEGDQAARARDAIARSGEDVEAACGERAASAGEGRQNEARARGEDEAAPRSVRVARLHLSAKVQRIVAMPRPALDDDAPMLR